MSAMIENRGPAGRDASSGPPSRPEDPDGRRFTHEPDHRIRTALGIEAERRLPAVDRSTLLRFYHYLASHLVFPFRARYSPESSSPETSAVEVRDALPPEQVVMVWCLLDPREWDRGEESGLLCAVVPPGRDAGPSSGQSVVPLVEVEVAPGEPNSQLLEDYWYWFWNWRNRRMWRWDVG